jgi:3-hydroxybutyryl-CoA dehydrogenase
MPDEEARLPSIPTVGIAGGGVMGCGLAEALISKGCLVVLYDISAEALSQARTRIRRSLMSAALLAGGAGEKLSLVMERLEIADDVSRLGAADFVIENVTEQSAAKTEIYRHLDAVCGPDVTIAANTSTFPISELATLVQDGTRVIGMHFMNPAPVKRVVEVIVGPHTSRRALDQADQLLRRMDKEMIVVGDGAGFVSNRVLMLTVNEAVRVVDEGIASAEAVDRVFCGCFGHAMGPLATADLIGLDTILLSLESLQTRRDQHKFEPSPLLRRMVAEGFLGRKAGRGFFEYSILGV